MDAYEIGFVRISAMVEDGGEPCYTAEAVGLAAKGASISECLGGLAGEIGKQAITNVPLNFPPAKAGEPESPEEVKFLSTEALERLRRHGLDMMAKHVNTPAQLTAVAHHAPTLLVFLSVALLVLHSRRGDSPWFPLGCALLKELQINTPEAIQEFATTFVDDLIAVRPVAADGSEKS